MAFAKDGKHFMNPAHARRHDAMAGMKPGAGLKGGKAQAGGAAMSDPGEASEHEQGMPPDEEPHESTPAAHEALMGMHAEHGGKHMLVSHHEDGTHMTHHIGEDGEPHGPHSHGNLDALKDHMDRFLEEEKNEY